MDLGSGIFSERESGDELQTKALDTAHHTLATN